MTVSFLGLSMSRTREGGVLVSLRYSYEGKPPSRKERIEAAKTLLLEVLGCLEGGEVADVGFQEDIQRRVRTDRMEAQPPPKAHEGV